MLKVSFNCNLVAGRTILPSIVSSLERIANDADPLRLVVQEISYKPFISFFNLTGVTDRNPELKGLRKSKCST